MSKEKNIQQQVDAEKKKEHTSVLEKIRKRTGLLVGIVGLALMIFILESLLGSGASIFGGSEMSTLGSINGKKIDRNEFVLRLENQLNNYRQRNQKNDIDDNTRTSTIENIWQQYIVDLVIKPQFDKAGITVGEDELYDRVVVNPVQSIIQQLSDPQTGKLNEQFARPDGSLDLVKWKQAVQNLPADQEPVLRQMEENVKNTRFFEKYRNLINKGLYITSAETKQALKIHNTQMNVSFVIKKFSAVSDSSIKLTDADLQKYYNDHSNEFKNLEDVRKIEYVAFNVMPSAEDLSVIEKDAQRVANEFKGLSVKEDSSFIAQESENGNITIQDFNKSNMVIRDSSVYKAAPGAVYGPYNEGAYFKVYKLQAINSVADSAKVRHILLAYAGAERSQATRTKAQAKREADSLLVLIKAKKVVFDTLTKTISDDGGGKTNGGNYGWFDENKGFAPGFKNAGLMGIKGNISVVETEFGYHIIEVLDASKGRHTNYTVAQIFKLIAPSDETNQKVFGQANQFGGENNTGELFDKAVAAQKLPVRMADNVKEGDRQLPGLDQAKELVKWAYTAKKGDVSVFSFTDKHVVAKLSGIKNKGILPMEDVKDLLVTNATQQKKADMFLEEFKNKAGGSKDVSDMASKLGLEVMNQERLSAEFSNVDGVGHDNIMIGTALGMKAGQTCKPTVSENGVFVMTFKSLAMLPEADVAPIKAQAEEALKGRSDYEVFNALKDISNIEDHKSRID